MSAYDDECDGEGWWWHDPGHTIYKHLRCPGDVIIITWLSLIGANSPQKAHVLGQPIRPSGNRSDSREHPFALFGGDDWRDKVGRRERGSDKTQQNTTKRWEGRRRESKNQTDRTKQLLILIMVNTEGGRITKARKWCWMRTRAGGRGAQWPDLGSNLSTAVNEVFGIVLLQFLL